MFLKFRAVQVLAPHPVVPTMQRDAVVINYPSGVYCPLEVFIPLVLIQLELQGLHGFNDTMYPYIVWIV
jgi:hypothetical protein